MTYHGKSMLHFYTMFVYLVLTAIFSINIPVVGFIMVPASAFSLSMMFIHGFISDWYEEKRLT
jgi:hypothetical protein